MRASVKLAAAAVALAAAAWTSRAAAEGDCPYCIWGYQEGSLWECYDPVESPGAPGTGCVRCTYQDCSGPVAYSTIAVCPN